MKHHPFLSSGFRPFFLGAMIFAVIAMLQWMAALHFNLNFSVARLTPYQWHAHEMIFGYTLAVIVGFLLTAVQNWTNAKTVSGLPLLVLFSLWVMNRLLGLFPSHFSLIAMLLVTTLFYAVFIVVIVRPLLLSKNNKQWAIVGKIVAIYVADVAFLYGSLGYLDITLLSFLLLIALYVVIGLILMMSRRVVPAFIQNTVTDGASVKNYPYIDKAAFALFLVIVLADIAGQHFILAIAGIVFAAVNIVRIYGWHHSEIWKKPLLWILWVAYGFIVLGLVLKALAFYLGILPSIPLHMMTYGGIALITTGMMSRVMLGHTGRNVFAPPKALGNVFILLILGAFFRTLMPLIMMGQYNWWLLISQVLWIVSFVYLLMIYFHALIEKRVDE